MLNFLLNRSLIVLAFFVPAQFGVESIWKLMGFGLIGLFLSIWVERLLERTSVVSPPGRIMQNVLSFVFSKKAFDQVFSQAIIDMREEHAEALAEQRLWKAHWVVVRDHLNLFLTVISYLAASVVKKVVGIWQLIS